MHITGIRRVKNSKGVVVVAMEENLLNMYEKGESKYLLINLAAKRIKKLLLGDRPQIRLEGEDDMGNVTLKEIEQGRLKVVPRKKAGKVIDLAKQNT